MQHPFDGILSGKNEAGKTSRREALRCLGAAGAAPLVLQAAALAGAAEPEGAPETAADTAAKDAYRLYFVVPKQFKAFTPRQRNELGVNGTYSKGLPENNELKEKKGFFAWLDEKQSQAVAAADDVAVVHRMEPDDVTVHGAPPKKGAATLRVHAAPFGWNTKLSKDSYQDIKALGEAWSKQFSMHEGVRVVSNKTVRTPFVIFADGKVPGTVVQTIKEHPQVYALQWMTPVVPTTKRLGEEGGATTLRVGEEGGVTTQAIGEEGGPRPSTRALGEEGGPRPLPRPKPTTLALGEEGGKAPPVPRPSLPQVTSQALGEEGGVRR